MYTLVFKFCPRTPQAPRCESAQVLSLSIKCRWVMLLTMGGAADAAGWKFGAHTICQVWAHGRRAIAAGGQGRCRHEGSGERIHPLPLIHDRPSSALISLERTRGTRMVESANTSAGTLRCDNGRTSGDTRPVHTAVGHKAVTAGGGVSHV